jgi:dTDP-4-amino-4,6-dideoxygalactose transaminase
MKVDERVTGHAWHLFQTRYDPAAFGGRDRAEFLKALNAEGVESSGGYVPLTYQAAIRNMLCTRFGEDSLANLADVPKAEHAGGHTIWFNQMLLMGSDDDMRNVIAACRKIQRAWG